MTGWYIIPSRGFIPSKGYRHEVSSKVYSRPERLDITLDDIEIMFSCRKYDNKRGHDDVFVERGVVSVKKNSMSKGSRAASSAGSICAV